MKSMKGRILGIMAAFVLGASAASAAPVVQTRRVQAVSFEQMSKKVRSQLVTLPYYGVFDNLAYKIEGGTVTLYGQVVRPSTRKDAERRVGRLAGVERVVNNIEVLPLSSFDDEIRVRTFREIQGTANLFYYMRGVNPSIHIVVNRGHLTLEGVVSTEGDRRLANFAARSVPGVFSVTNNLRTERGGRY
jgi:hyperosmotically inducible periplasmic protein